MNSETIEPPAEAVVPGERRGIARGRLRQFWIAAALVTAAFGGVLYSVLRLSWESSLHSHLPLIPVVSWFVWRFLDRRDENVASRSALAAFGTAALGVASLSVFYLLRGQRSLPATEWLWAGVLSYLLLLLAVAFWTFGWAKLKTHKFALFFLIFAVPLPVAATDMLSVWLQLGSAEVADWTLRLSGLPVLREDLVFRLPTMAVKVAEECSGVRSTLVLFITSLMAGKMFLRSTGKRAALALVTIPLGLLRNALRITVLAWLAVNVDSSIIHGPLHHQGGPIFFALSLIPLFVLLWYFRRSESPTHKKEK